MHEANGHKTLMVVVLSKRVPFQEPQTHAKVYINVWMSCVEHWAEAFRDAWIFLKFVREIGSGSLPPLVPSYQHNLDTNFKLSSRNWKFNDNGPSYFRNRSPYFIKKNTWAASSILVSFSKVILIVWTAKEGCGVRSEGDVKIEYKSINL